MKVLLSIALIFVAFAWAQPDACAQFNTTCSDCTANPNCGWCTAVQKCMSGDPTGPLNGFCLGPTWQFGTGNCVKCEKITDCRECLANGADCGWCASKNQCFGYAYFANNTIGGCKPAQTCSCNIYSSCSQCITSPSCQWCLEDGKCKDTSQTCTSGPGYNKTVGGCPCASNSDCSSCRDAFGCQWCNNVGTCVPQGTVNITANTTCLLANDKSCNDYCGQYSSSCSTCNNVNGCGWCSANNTCVDIDNSPCLLMHTCENCGNHKYCDPCTDNDACLWCAATSTCNSRKFGPACPGPITHSCPSYCAGFSNCYDCNARLGCGWCSAGSGSCLDTDNSQCGGLWEHSCAPVPLPPPVTPQTCGFDGGAFVGGMFLVIGLLVLAVLAYIVYRWKTGRKILYTELK